MRTLLFTAAILCSTLAFSQVGVNTSNPQASLDVVGKPTSLAIPDGVIAPRLTGNELKAKDAAYTSAQTGALVYVTAPVTTTSPKTINVTNIGYYFFNGTLWAEVVSSVPNSQKMIMSASVGGAQVINAANGVSGVVFPIENADTTNSFNTTTGIFTVVSDGVFTSNAMLSNSAIPPASLSWYDNLRLEKRINSTSPWTDLIYDTRSGLLPSDVANSLNVFWTGSLAVGNQLRVSFQTSHNLGVRIALGTWVITKIPN